ncbi:MAG: NYN domain-containing protein [Pseudomonadota bacterium]
MGKLKKVAIFVDWENVRKGIFDEASRKYPSRIDYNHVENVLALIKSFLDIKQEEIYRIFFYLAEPFSGTLRGINYSQTPTYQHAIAFIERLSIQDQIALRKGDLAVRGFDVNSKPIFIQKKVDMLMGLDIAHVSYNKLADRILVLCADTDIIPAMKTARINGLQVIFGYCSDLQVDIRRELKLHSDFIRDRQFSLIFPQALQSIP